MASARPAALLAPLSMGGLALKNRIALAPMTRGRSTAQPNCVPEPVMETYYEQRSNAGLVITEATGVNLQGLGWYCAPGIWSEEQTKAWTRIVDAVHKTGSVISLQLWHMGRAGHPDVTGIDTVAPSPVALGGDVTTVNGVKKPHVVPKEMDEAAIKALIEDYRVAAVNAKTAGFDFVELHAANGYLLDTFLQTKSNQRTDAYGGSLENRLRLVKEVLQCLITVFPCNRVGIRYSPNGAFQEMGSPDNVESFTEAIKLAGSLGLGYIHVMDGLGFGFHKLCDPFTLEMARAILTGIEAAKDTKLIGNAGYTKEAAEEQVAAGHGDMIAFGRPYISTPDLVYRFEHGLELNEDAPHNLWWAPGLGAKGYTDWPTYSEKK
eukprot:6485593-Amphidinium_carterae.1